MKNMLYLSDVGLLKNVPLYLALSIIYMHLV